MGKLTTWVEKRALVLWSDEHTFKFDFQNLLVNESAYHLGSVEPPSTGRANQNTQHNLDLG